MDFGIARMRVADHKTSTGIVLGTPRYMSPEQIAGQPVDQRSDIFSLGIVLYEMLTGKRLFSGTEIGADAAHSITYDEHVPPTRVNPELPSMLDFVVARALKKDPAVRYQDADEMAADLHTCLAELRGRQADPSEPDSGSKTVKLDVDGEPTLTAPAAVDDRAGHAPAGVAPLRFHRRAAPPGQSQGRTRAQARGHPAPARGGRASTPAVSRHADRRRRWRLHCFRLDQSRFYFSGSERQIAQAFAGGIRERVGDRRRRRALRAFAGAEERLGRAG